MKKVIPDLVDYRRAEFVNATGRLRKFRRFWGTEKIDGVEVFRHAVFYYPSPSEQDKKAIRFLKLEGDLFGQSMSGIKRAWLFLNMRKFKTDANDLELSQSTIASNLFRAAVKYRGSATSVFLQASLINTLGGSVVFDRNERAPSQIKKNIENFLKRPGSSMSNDSSDAYYNLLNTATLLSTNSTIVIHSITDDTIAIPIIKARRVRGYRYLDSVEIRYEIKIPSSTTLASTAAFIISSYKSPNNEYKNSIKSKLNTAAYGVDDASTEDADEFVQMPDEFFLHADGQEPKEALASELDLDYSSLGMVTDKHFYKGRLRADFIEDKTIPLKERLDLLYGCLDSDYKKKKKKTKWYHYVAAVIIIVVAIVLAVFTAGTSAYAGGLTVAAMFAVATTITIAALYISLAMLALSLLGATQITGAVSNFMKTIEPLVTIASIITIVGAYQTAINKGIETATAEIAKQGVAEGTKQAAGIVAKEVAIELTKTLVKQVTGISFTPGASFQNTIRAIEIGFEYHNKNQMKSLAKELKREERLLAEMQEAEEKSKVSDVVKEFAAAQGQLLNADWSIYAELYDRPYEWWSTPYHTGCIQANSVNALWLKMT